MPDRTQLLKRSVAEFLIIVTGILAAFYVDEFRDSRRASALEREYVGRLAADLEDAQQNLAAGVPASRQRADAGRAVLAHLAGDVELAPDRLIIAAYEAALFPIARERRLGRRTTYDDLIATGNLGMLRDVELREALARYYEEYARVGARLENRPEGWRSWVEQHLSPDAVLALTRDCLGCTEGPEPCPGDVTIADQVRFRHQLGVDADYARGELNRITQYQDRQLDDLVGFQAATEIMSDRLRRSGLRR